MLSFVKCLLKIFWYDHMIFVLSFLKMMYHIDWYVDVHLQSWNKSHLTMVYEPFNELVNSVWVHLLKIFVSIFIKGSVQFSSVTHSCPTLCNPMNHSTPGLPVHHQLPESTQTHVHCVGDAIQPPHPLSSPSPPSLNLSQHQGIDL